jgi:hypothetical protein
MKHRIEMGLLPAQGYQGGIASRPEKKSGFVAPVSLRMTRHSERATDLV